MPDIISVLIFIIVIVVLICLRVRINNKECMWYWDNITRRYCTQCGDTVRMVNRGRKIPFKDCTICKRPIAVNPFIDRQEGRP